MITSNRWQHILGVARKAKILAQALRPNDEKYLEDMFLLGMLHDFGYEFTENGKKHAMVAGQILERSGYKYWQDVVNHSEKATDNMSDETFIINCADLSVSPDGKDITISARVEDIGRRHGKNSTQYLIALEKLQKLQADARFSKIESYV